MKHSPSEPRGRMAVGKVGAMAKRAVGHHPGATWRRVDFQVHTPRDPDWSGGPTLPGGEPKSEAKRVEWATALVEACRKKGLQAIAITDHHDICMIRYVQRALRELDLEQEIWLFPGMEVTCDDACQALIILDVETTEAQWERIFGCLPAIARADDALAQIPQAQQCGKQIEQFIAAVSRDKVLEPVCIVLPHAGDEGAHKSVVRARFNVRFQKLDCDGVYTDRPFEKLKARTKRIVFGEQAEWGRRRRGLIPTGDNRRSDFEDLGKSPCWIRLGEPTAEAVRQALLVDEARICYEPPSLPAQRIRGFRVSSVLTGEMEVSLNDGFSAIIGGRGSGKSALLEYLRFGLGRSSLDVETDSSEHERLQDLLRRTLIDGCVEVVLERDGVVETWKRSLEESDIIEIRVENAEEQVPIAVAQERFRARAYEQKGLSSILPSRRSAMEQITSIAAAELWEKRHTAQAAVDRARRDVRLAFLRVVEVWHAEAEARRTSGRIADLNRRLKALGEQLAEKGLSAADKATLESGPCYNRGRSFFDEASGALVEAKEEAGRVREELLAAPDLPEVPEDDAFAPLRAYEKAAQEVQTRIERAVGQIVAELEGLGAILEDQKALFEEGDRAFRERYQLAVEHQSELKKVVRDQEHLQGELASAEMADREASRKLSGLEGAEDVLERSRAALTAAVEHRRAVLEEASEATEGMSGGLLRAEVRQAEVPEEYAAALKDLAAGARIHDLDVRADERAQEIAAEEKKGWGDLCERLLTLFRRKVNAGDQADQVGAEEIQSDLDDALFPVLTERQLEEIFARLSEDRVARVLTAVNEDSIAFDYKDRDGFISFESASPGQQASALLQLLLSQEAGTLIIDQPEDDLDSGVVMQIVSLLIYYFRESSPGTTTSMPPRR